MEMYKMYPKVVYLAILANIQPPNPLKNPDILSKKYI